MKFIRKLLTNVITLLNKMPEFGFRFAPFGGRVRRGGKGIVYANAKHYELGDVAVTPHTIYILDIVSGTTFPALPELKNNPWVVYSPLRGCYLLKGQLSDTEDFIHETKRFGIHLWPYHLIPREYGAFHTMDMISEVCKKVTSKKTFTASPLAKYLKYSFGLEFETSMGAIPEEECFEKGLIPLRDGSISGVEYSTIVLEGNNGINLLKEQLQALNKNTRFNKECALHIHFGKFPVNKDAILAVNNLCRYLQYPLLGVCPEATFKTSLYKANKKDYCNMNEVFDSFNSLYRSLVGISYMGDLYQPHPADPEKTGKWNIKSRYQMCNLVNMVCYKSPKTVEFRFLRPTHNIDLIYFWLWTLNALLKTAESVAKMSSDDAFQVYESISLQYLYKNAYPPEIASALNEAACALKAIRDNQRNNGDICGSMTEFEDSFELPAILKE